MMSLSRLGADLAGTHGAIVGEGGDLLLRLHSLTMPVNGSQATRLGLLYSMAVPAGSEVRVDWDPRIGSWGRGNGPVLTTALIFSFSTAVVLAGGSVLFVTPAAVRASLLLNQKASKSEVWAAAGVTGPFEDYRDALVLARMKVTMRV